MFGKKDTDTDKREKNSISDSIVVIESYISLAQNFIENNEEIHELTPLYLTIEKIDDEVKKIKQIYERA